MKKLYPLITLFSVFFCCAQNTLIPDVNFESALINKGIDSGVIDGKVLTANISGITSLDISANDITNLTGIQDFVSLTSLECSRNRLSSLDVTNNISLTQLNCWGNNLTNLDLTRNTKLTYLSCFQNQLTSLDISKNSLMSYLICSWNELTSLNLKNGNNSDLFALNAFNNPNLSCIQVDNEAVSNSWDPSKKDAAARYSEDCSKTLATITPPVITATGNQTYCAGTSLKIVKTISITSDPAEPDTDAIYIQIAAGYVSNQDNLTLSNSAAHPKIITAWDSVAGKLMLYSPTGVKIPYTDFEAAIKDIVYSNSSSNPSGTRNFAITIGQANYLPSTGHYYQFVPEIGISWTAARSAAKALNYYGLKGYLATISSLEEVQISGEQAKGAGWIGGSDFQNEGVWKWVTGPEGLANAGNGVVFWNGGVNGTTPNFAYWNKNEPNQSGNENYAHITASGVGILGSWNDLKLNGDESGDYQPKGYIVEYGGMPGDPTLQISASTTITIPQITNKTSSSICGSGVVTLQATATNGAVNWYATPTGGTKLFTGNSFTTPTLSTTTSYYVDASNGSCPNGPRTEIVATIKALPSLPQIATSSITPVLYCLSAPAIPLAATASTDCFLKWYTLPNGGVASTTSPTPITTVAGSTTYYVSQTNTVNGCESPRAAIIVTVNPLPTAPIVSNKNYCSDETAVPLVATASANCTLNWYTTALGGTSSPTSSTPSTTTLGSTKYYVSQTITSTGCEGPRAEIIVIVNPLPTAPIVSDIVYCHNETAIPITATASANSSLNWYTIPTGGTSRATSPTPSTATVGTTKYYVSQTITATGCEGPRSEISVIINPLPIVKDVEIIQCDTDLIVNGKTFFNLTVNNTEISANSTNENFTYYTSLNGANNAVPADLILNELAFENTTPTVMDIWSRVSNKITGCYSVAKITLKVPATNISPNYKITFPPICDDFLDVNGNNNENNNKRDGITTFDMTTSRAELQNLLPTSDTYTINYYKNEADALAETNVITDISNYRNIGYPNSQDIWIRIDSDLDNACYGLGPYLTLNVQALPVANTVIIPRQCDDNNDGIFTFNTSSLESDLLQGQNNVAVTYFDQANNPLKDANGVMIASPFPVNFLSTSQTITAVVTNNTLQQCFDETIINFVVDASSKAFSVPTSLITACDDEANPINQDGKFAFDTSSFETTILGGQAGMIIKYYDQNNVLLPSPLPNPFITSTQNITAIVENPINTTCTASTILKFVVHPVPNIDLNLDGLSNQLVCLNLSTFFVTLDAGITDGSPTIDYDYIWTRDGINTGTNSPTLAVNIIGVYTVEVINNSGCSRIRTITVTASSSATISAVNIEDLTDANTVTVNVNGSGSYEYSIDEPNGFWQDSNVFTSVPAGIHIVYINDKNGCGPVYQEIVIVGVPKFFTPNGDGQNDYWSIKGVNETFNSKSIIYIYDRYGKLIKQWIPAASLGWDGTFNGIPLPADDYWFTLKLEDGREKKGHFSLKR
ncbi:T9SS type B sorting domain-containing protein [Flavobacterium sp. W20_MBD1_R3]|uniref:Ig-like domain-containing protein n=1 Tax=Flavobacterium sp. W20_MBD1_R3 TaxID=3240278 RepID=UPI003F90418D